MHLRKAKTHHKQLSHDERVVPYSEFQSAMLKLTKLVHNRHLPVKAAFQKLKYNNYFFMPVEENKSRMMFHWPYHEENREITATYLLTDTNQQIDFFYQNERFLTLSINNSLSLQAFLHESPLNKKVWQNENIKELVETFNQVIQAKNIIYKPGSPLEVTYAYKGRITHFNKNEFQNIITQYQNNNLTSRIENTIIRHAKRSGEKYSFYLDWPDCLQQHHSLKITFSRMDHFYKKYSWIMNEKTLLNKFSNSMGDKIHTKPCYYSLSVMEVLKENKTKSYKVKKSSAKKEIEILNIWLAVDGLIGELRNLKKGENLSGNDVLAIYNYFDQLFKVKNTLICDESKLSDEKDSVRIPLRLISSLCTGKTWYENKLTGVKLFECKEFKSAYNGIITQCTEKRDKALKDLQQLPLSDWYEMLDEKGKLILANLFNCNDKCLFGNATLQDLTILLFNESKEKRTITPHLVEFTNLLCDGMNRNHKLKPLKNQPDYWVKSRVKEILWGGYFWIKEATAKAITDNHLSPRTAQCKY